MNQPVDPMVDGLVRYRLDLGYDGTNFNGWAKQDGLRTVAGHLLEVLTIIYGEDADDFGLRVAGRTDAGVHATAQVAHIDLSAKQLRRLGRAVGMVGKLNDLLDSDVRVYSAEVAPAGFDARFSATYRRYRYRIADGLAQKNPLKGNHTLWINHKLDVNLMIDAAPEFLGLQDFFSFCRPRDFGTTIRELREITVKRNPLEENVIEVELMADAFAHNMVRSIVGGLKAVGEAKATRADIRAALDAKKRAGSYKVQPAHGLTLIEIGYPDDHELANQATITKNLRSIDENRV